MKKYKLLKNEYKEYGELKLYRIQALMDFGNVSKGDKGGYIEKKENLSEDGNAWVYGYAGVSGNAEVYGYAGVSGNAWVYGYARVYGNAEVYGYARVYGNAEVYGDAEVSGKARVYGDAVIKTTKGCLQIGPLGENRYITITKSDGMVCAGCFRGTLSEFKKAVRKKYPKGTDYNWFFSAVSKYLKSKD